jgi:hypothetical protein
VTLVLPGVVLLVVGLLGYSGVWRSWSTHTFLHWPFGVAWAGLGIIVAGSGGMIGVAGNESVGGVLQLVGMGVGLFGVVGAFMLPPFLLPAWYRRAMAAARR